MDERWITIAQATKITGKSATSLKRLIKTNNVPTKREEKSKTAPILLDRLHLIQSLTNGQPSVQPVLRAAVNQTVKQADERYLNHLEKMIEKLNHELDRLRGQVEQQRQENRALNEEIKAHLRERNKSKGIAGYLIDQLWRSK